MGLVLDDQDQTTDKTKEIEGIKLSYDPQLEYYVESSLIDYRQGIMGEYGFVIMAGYGC